MVLWTPKLHVVFIRGCHWPSNVKKNAIHPPFDLYALFLEIKIARMQWVEYVAKLTDRITCRKTVTSESRKDKTKTQHKRTVFEDELWMEMSQGSCVMVRSVIRDIGSSYSAATLKRLFRLWGISFCVKITRITSTYLACIRMHMCRQALLDFILGSF
jgi:hypothetical protein